MLEMVKNLVRTTKKIDVRQFVSETQFHFEKDVSSALEL